MKSCLWCHWLDTSVKKNKVAKECESCNQLTKSNFKKRGRHNHENEKKNK